MFEERVTKKATCGMWSASRQAAAGCCGIVHLAAVSRVVWGERDPETCREVNAGGLRNVLAAAAKVRGEPSGRPWVVFASSREVYGQPDHDRLPVTEDAPLQPINVYGRSKVEGERLVEAARDEGLRAAIVRLSNVYGSTRDHADRVVPAFVRGAVLGSVLRVEGADHTFDFTHIDDATRGIVAIIDLLADGKTPPPPVHLLTGRPAARSVGGRPHRDRSNHHAGAAAVVRRIPLPRQPGAGAKAASGPRVTRARASPASTATRRGRESCSVGLHTWRFSRAWPA